MMEDELRGQLATLLGGRAAEEIVFGKVSTGASDDIQKATDLAIKAITQYGMSRALGPIAFQKQHAQFLSDRDVNRSISPEVAAKIDQEVKGVIDQAYQTALDILSLNQELMSSMASVLLENEVLEGDALETMLSKASLPLPTAN